MHLCTFKNYNSLSYVQNEVKKNWCENCWRLKRIFLSLFPPTVSLTRIRYANTRRHARTRARTHATARGLRPGRYYFLLWSRRLWALRLWVWIKRYSVVSRICVFWGITPSFKLILTIIYWYICIYLIRWASSYLGITNQFSILNLVRVCNVLNCFRHFELAAIFHIWSMHLERLFQV